MRRLLGRFVCVQAMMACVVAIVFSEGERAFGVAFQNLGFESAVLDGLEGCVLPVEQAFPGWTVSGGAFVGYNTIALDSVAVTLHDAGSTLVQPMEGNCSILLQEGDDPSSPPEQYPEVLHVPAYISQTGDIPTWATALTFMSDMNVDRLMVSINGGALPYHVYSVGETVNSHNGPVATYIADISAFSGKTGMTLKFTKLLEDPFDPYEHGSVDLDNIRFVPEPSSFVLLGIGLFSLAGYRWRRRLAS
jgi:hypothetical protein